MVRLADLRKIIRARLRDAEALHRARRYEAGVYLCGYAVELGLKARACRSLKWRDFPSQRGEFKGIESFRTHDLEALLRLSGVEDRVRTQAGTEWLTVRDWSPALRYQVPGTVTANESLQIIAASRRLLSCYDSPDIAGEAAEGDERDRREEGGVLRLCGGHAR